MSDFINASDYRGTNVEGSEGFRGNGSDLASSDRVSGVQNFRISPILADVMNEFSRLETELPDTSLATFARSVDMIGSWVHRTMIQKGFWDSNRSDAEAVALMHSELSEALESMRARPDGRTGKPPRDPHCPMFGNVEIELADCVIRIMDFCKAKGLDLGPAIVAKMVFNESRPPKHGKQF